jgi:hypothetical protein
MAKASGPAGDQEEKLNLLALLDAKDIYETFSECKIQ